MTLDWSPWSFPESSSGGWVFSFTRDSEAMDFFRISDDDAGKLAEILGTTKARLSVEDAETVHSWNQLMVNASSRDPLGEIGIAATQYREWIPGGDFGYSYDIDTEGGRRSSGGDL